MEMMRIHTFVEFIRENPLYLRYDSEMRSVINENYILYTDEYRVSCFLTACCYLVIGNPTVIIMRLKYNVHSLIYSKPIFEEKREPENKKIFLFVLFIGNPLSETWFLCVSWLQQFFS